LLLVVLANFLGLIFASERSAWLGMLCALLCVCFYISPRRFFEGLVALSIVVCSGLVYRAGGAEFG
jgi:hypothetical protein